MLMDEINFKEESWKFTPFNLLKTELSSNKSSFLEEPFYMGPDEAHLAEQTWKDLEKEGYVEISNSTGLIGELEQLPAFEKAKMSSVFEKKAENGIKIKFIKNLPSPLWLTLSHYKENITFNFAESISSQIVFIEKEIDIDGLKLFPFDFILDRESQADLFFNFKASGRATLFSHASLKESSKLRVFNFFGGRSLYKRIEFRSFQQGKNSEVSLNGLSLLRNESVADYHTDSFHLEKNQKTNQTYKTIGKDMAKNIFGGRVHLTKASEGAEVDQINRNILLSKRAHVDSQPELNIDQDDVTATHGAATSSLDDEHFFYLASRGFEKDQARSLLVDAFCKDALFNEIPKGIEEYMNSQIEEDLRYV